ncbi:DUF4188 domain-containing protein [Microbacterium sp. JZ31]|uniref:DUF4188 domain-containing protein n=1 Tax=Microbacterium sp. JZ31 TaxID=1906274 RepID=UPI001934A62C|nr:DUF4188 domain-containing protein [Microbacterium sp. JZ31]
MIVNPGRMTHDHDGELVVFLVGMRINRWSRPDLWWPTLTAMPPMMRELAGDPASGMLAQRLFGFPRSPTVLQYWTSVEKLYAYASDRDASHRPAWAAFNRRARDARGAVGIWHETFSIARAESIYVGMPPTGLGAATSLKPVTARLDRARQRFDAEGDPV